eukprot:scaffold10567_cov101-Isochrysis_galbana.AAC.2
MELVQAGLVLTNDSPASKESKGTLEPASRIAFGRHTRPTSAGCGSLVRAAGRVRGRLPSAHPAGDRPHHPR